MHRQTAFARADMIAAFAMCSLVLISLLTTPGCGGGGASNSNKLEASNRLRSIYRALVTAAQNNKSHYAGLNSDGELTPDGANPATRYSLLLKAKLLEPKDLINPIETGRTLATGDAVTKANFSFALLRIDEANGRRSEWKDTQNHRAAIASDRNVGGALHTAQSIAGTQGWQGAVLWGDGHSLWEMTSLMKTTRYHHAEISGDDLFGNDNGTIAEQPAPPGNDAAMVYHDAVSYTYQN